MSTGNGRKIETYRIVMVSLWETELRGLSTEAVFVYLRMRTGPESLPIPGVVVIGRAGLAEAVGWKRRKVDAALQELIAGARIFADFDHRLIWIPRAAVDGSPDNPNQVLGWRRWWSPISPCLLKRRIRSDLRRLLEPRGNAFLDAFDEAIPEELAEPSWERSPEPSGNVAPMVPETGGGSGSGGGIRKGVGGGNPNVTGGNVRELEPPLLGKETSDPEADPERLARCLDAFRSSRALALRNPHREIVATDSAADLAEFEAEIGRHPEADENAVRVGAELFFGRDGETTSDPFWRRRKWSLHVFSTSLGVLVAEAKAQLQHWRAGANAKERSELAGLFPMSCALETENPQRWKDLVELHGLKRLDRRGRHEGLEAQLAKETQFQAPIRLVTGGP